MLNNYESTIVGIFAENLDQYDNEIMELVWKDGSKIKAEFDTCFEDDNDLEMDEKGYEEFTSFAFNVISVSGTPPVFITEDNGFLIDYHNFPSEILVNGEKIN